MTKTVKCQPCYGQIFSAQLHTEIGVSVTEIFHVWLSLLSHEVNNANTREILFQVLIFCFWKLDHLLKICPLSTFISILCASNIYDVYQLNVQQSNILKPFENHGHKIEVENTINTKATEQKGRFHF